MSILASSSFEFLEQGINTVRIVDSNNELTHIADLKEVQNQTTRKIFLKVSVIDLETSEMISFIGDLEPDEECNPLIEL